MKKLSFFLITALFVGISAAQVKNVAVVETEIDAQSGASADITPAEVRLVTAELRREAVKNLPRDKYNIMTSETVYAQGGAVIEECSEENCVIVLGSKIGADYIVRGTISKFQTKFTLTVELYETENGNLVASSDPVRSENVGDLLDKATAACANMYKTFANTHDSLRKPPVTYTLTVGVNPANGGTVSRNPNQTYYAPGTSVDIMAVPANGYRFTGWTDDTTDAANTITVTMSDNMTLTANFQPFQRTYTLTTNVSPSGGGSVTRSPDKEIYAEGEMVSVTATAENGYTFTDWTGAISSRKNRITVTMNGDKALTATFYKKIYVESKPEPAAQKQSGLQEKPRAKMGAGGVSNALSALSDAYVLPGVYISHNLREGYRKFDDADGYLHVENTNPFIIGLAVGKRISIDDPRLRFQAAVELGRGSVKDLEYETVLSDGTREWPELVSLYSIYWTGGLLADAHLLFPVDNRTFFISAGLGAHLTYFDVALRVSESGDKVSGVGSGMRGALSPSINIGGGVEYSLNGRGATSISYNLRFWRSASYKEVSLPFPMGVNYTEFFFSQSIQLQYLLPRRRNNG